MKNIIKAFIITGIIITSFASCQSATNLSTYSINKNISIDAKIASIDAYGNITLNILTKDLLEANFNYENKLLLKFSNGYLIESSLTPSNNNIDEGECYIRTVNTETPVTVGIKAQNLAEVGTLNIGDLVQIYQLSPK